jgi:hypothetical protein
MGRTGSGGSNFISSSAFVMDNLPGPCRDGGLLSGFEGACFSLAAVGVASSSTAAITSSKTAVFTVLTEACLSRSSLRNDDRVGLAGFGGPSFDCLYERLAAFTFDLDRASWTMAESGLLITNC